MRFLAALAIILMLGFAIWSNKEAQVAKALREAPTPPVVTQVIPSPPAALPAPPAEPKATPKQRPRAKVIKPKPKVKKVAPAPAPVEPKVEPRCAEWDLGCQFFDGLRFNEQHP